MINEKEKQIINELKKDSRQPIKSISKKTGINPSTVYKIINKLKNNNIIEKFTIKLNDKILQKNFIVYMLVITSKNLEPKFLRNDCIQEVHGITGEYDLLLKLKLKDFEDFNKFIINFRKNDSIVKTLTMVATTKIKEI